MKRIFLTTVLLMLFITLFSISFGSSNVNINVNGSTLAVPQVAVMMDGRSLASEVPSFVMGDRTLVPIRFVAESFGAKVDWNNDTRTASVTHQGSRLDLTIDSDVVLVNGNAVKIDQNSIPKLVTFTSLNDSRTMVPVRFVSEMMGYDVGWDASSYTALINSPQKDNSPTAVVSAIEAEEGRGGLHRIRIESDRELEFTSMFIQASNKLVLDFENARIDLRGSSQTVGDFFVNGQVVQRLQYSQFTLNPYTTRVVLTLTGNEDFRIQQLEGGKTTYILFGNDSLERPEEPQEPNDPEIPEKEERPEYTGPRMIRQEMVDGQEAIVVYGLKDPQYQVIKLSEPARLVVDIMDTKILGELYQEFDYQFGFIKGVRASQYTGDARYGENRDVVRVVLDIRDGARDPGIIVRPERDRLVIIPEEDAWDALRYENRDFESFFEFKNKYPARYDIAYDNLLKELKLTLPLDATSLPDGTYQIGDKVARDVTVQRGRNETEITIRFRRAIVYSLLSNPGDQTISIKAVRNENVNPQEITVVVDAGHGGKDPGAVAGNIREKDINLSTALKLRDALMAKGYNVIMTRDADVFVDLYKRAAIANENNADLFISIHANATLSTAITGLEVYYTPAMQSDKKVYDQYPFAKLVYDNILASTGREGRGVRQGKFVVIRETSMPAVLVELGYMTNPSELSLISTDVYQNQAVNGIVNAVDKYIREY